MKILKDEDDEFYCVYEPGIANWSEIHDDFLLSKKFIEDQLLPFLQGYSYKECADMIWDLLEREKNPKFYCDCGDCRMWETLP